MNFFTLFNEFGKRNWRGLSEPFNLKNYSYKCKSYGLYP